MKKLLFLKTPKDLWHVNNHVPLLRKYVSVIVYAFASLAMAENAQLLSFGFYQTDNAMVHQNHIATVPSVAAGISPFNIEITMPNNADLAAPVARFIENDGSTVTADGVALARGVTKNAINVPIDQIVCNRTGNNNLHYTVSLVNTQWKVVHLTVYLRSIAWLRRSLTLERMTSQLQRER